MIKSAAILAIAATGCRTVVNSGQIMQATGASVLRWRNYEKFLGPLLRLTDLDP